ncbi:hypothetical protein [Exiguobacterium sp. RIT594]|uniref:hypothetical protein n=1 Tax=Exiguobacterium sp. RIT594 TaxID=2282449 RepID=UPI000DF81CE1|nr:hypothetical protein [Exiguobacterium sp. RIT594]RDB33975.1 hypothetical protein DVG79_04660 [Exiguobacterium sp. RIT594]
MHPIKDMVTPEQFETLDIRVGTIRSLHVSDAEPSFLNLLIAFGDFQQSVFLDWKESRFEYEEIVGKQALVLLNVPGIVTGTTGRILELGTQDHLMPVLACPEHPLPDGSRLS